MRAATCASSRATRVPETNRRSTNSRLTAGTTVIAGGSTTRGVSAAVAADTKHAAVLPGANLSRSTRGRAHGATTLVAQAPPSATAAAAATMIRVRRII